MSKNTIKRFLFTWKNNCKTSSQRKVYNRFIRLYANPDQDAVALLEKFERLVSTFKTEDQAIKKLESIKSPATVLCVGLVLLHQDKYKKITADWLVENATSKGATENLINSFIAQIGDDKGIKKEKLPNDPTSNDKSKTPFKSTKEFNEATIKIAQSWDDLYSALRCRKNTYRSGDTCYMYINGYNKSGDRKFYVRCLDWGELILFKEGSTQGKIVDGSVDQFIRSNSDLYWIPSLYTEGSLRKKTKDYIPSLYKLYLENTDSYNLIRKLSSYIISNIVKCIEFVKNNPNNALTIDKITVDRKNYPEMYDTIDNLLDDAGFTYDSKENFEDSIKDVQDILEHSDKFTEFYDTYHQGTSYKFTSDNLTWIIYTDKQSLNIRPGVGYMSFGLYIRPNEMFGEFDLDLPNDEKIFGVPTIKLTKLSKVFK